MNKPLSTLDRTILTYESRHFQIVERGWTFMTPPARKAGETQQMEDCGDFEFFRIYTGISKQCARTTKYIYQEYLLLSRRKE